MTAYRRVYDSHLRADCPRGHCRWARGPWLPKLCLDRLQFIWLLQNICPYSWYIVSVDRSYKLFQKWWCILCLGCVSIRVFLTYMVWIAELCPLYLGRRKGRAYGPLQEGRGYCPYRRDRSMAPIGRTGVWPQKCGLMGHITLKRELSHTDPDFVPNNSEGALKIA